MTSDYEPKNYLCLLRSPGGQCEPPPSPSDMEAMLEKYRQWQETFAENIFDMGGKLTAKGAVVVEDAVSDGPYAEIKELIGGYMMIQATSLEEAIAVIQASPMVATPGVSIEIREIQSL